MIDIQRITLEIAQLYQEAEQRVLRELAQLPASKANDEMYWRNRLIRRQRDVLEAVNNIYDKTDAVIMQEINMLFQEAYLQGYENNGNIMRELQGKLPSVIPFAVMRLAAEQQMKVGSIKNNVLRQVDDFYRQAQGSAITNKMSRGYTRIQASQELLNNIANRGISKFIDRAGRQWDAGAYAEMAIRTGTANLARMGMWDSFQASGYDLVYVSSHMLSCPLCGPWQGDILSISGQDTRYPSIYKAKEAGLFHPNCRHTTHLYVKGLSDVNKTEYKGEKDYVATQRQRAMERQIRQWKRRQETAVTEQERLIASNKVKEWNSKLKEHTDSNNLQRKRYREGIGKTRYGNNPTIYGGTDKYIKEWANRAHREFTGKNMKQSDIDSFVKQFANVRDWSTVRNGVSKFLNT